MEARSRIAALHLCWDMSEESHMNQGLGGGMNCNHATSKLPDEMFAVAHLQTQNGRNPARRIKSCSHPLDGADKRHIIQIMQTQNDAAKAAE